MAGSKGNNNAEKWTNASTIEMLSKIEKEALKPSCIWLGSALVKVGLYKDVWAYWKEKFADDQIVFRTIKKIEQIFEDRLFTQAVKGKAQSTVAIFALKNNHGWTDRSEVETKITKSYESLTEDEIQQEIDRLRKIQNP